MSESDASETRGSNSCRIRSARLQHPANKRVRMQAPRTAVRKGEGHGAGSRAAPSELKLEKSRTQSLLEREGARSQVKATTSLQEQRTRETLSNEGTK